MRKLTQMVITLPLLVAPLALVAVVPAKAQVQDVDATGAVRLLAQSSTADAKCRYLKRSENTELRDYLTKAEVAAAEISTAAQAQKARQQGKRLGKQMACGETGQGLVLATLDAARRAMAAARAQQKTRKVAASRQPRRKIIVRRRAGRQFAPGPVVSNLIAYRQITEAYYLERRCLHLPRADTVRFWERVVASHNAVLRRYTKSQVAKAKQGAEIAAQSRGQCGARTARIVQSGYRG